MSRSDPKSEQRTDAANYMATMQEIARARAAMLQGQPALQADVRKLVDRLAAAANFRSAAETVPVDSSVQRGAAGRAAPRGR